MNNTDIGCLGVNAFQYVLTMVQTEQALRIISLVLSVLSTLIILVMKFIDWYKDAKKDGKITKEEVKQLIDDNKDIVKKVVNDIKEVKQESQKEKKE